MLRDSSRPSWSGAGPCRRRYKDNFRDLFKSHLQQLNVEPLCFSKSLYSVINTQPHLHPLRNPGRNYHIRTKALAHFISLRFWPSRVSRGHSSDIHQHRRGTKLSRVHPYSRRPSGTQQSHLRITISPRTCKNSNRNRAYPLRRSPQAASMELSIRIPPRHQTDPTRRSNKRSHPITMNS